jgi:hypothetical protein
MIFKMKMNVLVAVLTLGFASAALATDSDDNCGYGCGPSTGLGLTLNVTGLSSINGNTASIFEGDFGTIEVTQEGDSYTDIESSLGGFCPDGDCSNTELSIDLMANQQGSADTAVGGETSGDDVIGQNAGQFNSGTQAGIDFGDTSTTVGTFGAAAFANNGVINAVGENVHSTMESYGTGETVSKLTTNGTACPSCVDFGGGTTGSATSGINLMSTVSGSASGQMIQIGNSALSESAASLGNMFNQESN